MEVIKISNPKIGTVEAIFIMLSVVVARATLSLSKSLVSLTNSSTIINIVFISIIAIILGLLICKLIKSLGNGDIIDISEYLGGKVLKNIVGTIFIINFVVCSSMLLRNFCEGLEIVYFQMTDIIFVILLFVIGMCIVNHLGFNATFKANLIILPIALLSIVLIFFANFKNFDPQKMFPILGDGAFNTFVTGLINLASFEGILYLYLLPPHLKKPENYKKIVIISILITSIYLVLCVSIILFIFPAFFTTNEMMTLYSAARYISFGTFLQRLESIFMLVWIMNFVSYLAITCKFSLNIFQKMTNVKNTKPLVNIFGLLILGVALLPKNVAISSFFENYIYNHIVIGITFILGIGILIIAYLKKRYIQKA